MADAGISGEPNPSRPAAPSVVAVVVTRDPGPWFPTVLRSLVDQDYRNLSILVLDAASEVDPTPMVAEAAPDAFVRRFDRNPGFGAIANEVEGMVEGAAFFLFLHDDVALDPGAIRQLVEETFRSNAGVVGPKLVDWDDPTRLVHAGMGSDKFGVPSPIVEVGELDQEQHDSVRDVFAVSSAALLIRADLFHAIGGFDPAISFFEEDSDLCWRAHIAGARVLAVPAARGRHVGALAERDGWTDHHSRQLAHQARHRLRNVLTNYGAFHLVAILVQQVVLSILEFALALARGRVARARAIAGAYAWNVRQIPSILQKRKTVKSVRQLSDIEIRRLQVRGSSRFNTFVRRSIGDNESGADAGRGLVESVRSGVSQEAAITVALMTLVLLAGSRHLITRSIPGVGEFAAFDSASNHLSEWWTGWSRAGLGTLAADPSLIGLTGVLGFLVFGAMGFLRTWLVLGLLPIGLVGAWRLGDVEPSSRGKLVAMLSYAAMPVAYNALAGGHWSALGAFAAAPWIVRRLAVVASGPGTGEAGFGPIRQGLGLGLIAGAGAFLHPGLVLAPIAVGLTLVLGSLLVFELGQIHRVAIVTVLASITAAILHIPWMLGLGGGNGWGRLLRSRVTDPLDNGDLIRMVTGPFGSTILVYGVILAGLLALAVGLGDRLTTAVRGWALVLVSWLAVFAADRDWVSVPLPADDVLFAFGASGLALATSAGVAAFETDVRGRRFGWRQVTSLLALLLVFLGPLTTIGAAFGGRWGLPRGGFERTFSFVVDEADELGPMRSLWLGDAEVLPMAGSALEGSALSFATIDGGVPRVVDQWQAPPRRTDDLIPAALELATDGETNRLGRLLAPFGVRYVVVAHRSAPAPFAAIERPADESVVAALASQLDLTPIEVSPGSVDVFRNQAWRPIRGAATSDAVPDFSSEDIPAAFADRELVAFEPVLGLDAARQRAAGPVEAGTDVIVLDQSADRWELSVDGDLVERARALGWASRWPIERSGEAILELNEPSGRRWLLIAQLVAWPLVIAGLFVEGRGRRPRRSNVGTGVIPVAVDAGEPAEASDSGSDYGDLADVDDEDLAAPPGDRDIDLRDEIVDLTDAAVAQEAEVDRERAKGLATFDADDVETPDDRNDDPTDGLPAEDEPMDDVVDPDPGDVDPADGDAADVDPADDPDEPVASVDDESDESDGGAE